MMRLALEECVQWIALQHLVRVLVIHPLQMSPRSKIGLDLVTGSGKSNLHELVKNGDSLVLAQLRSLSTPAATYDGVTVGTGW